MIISPAEQDRLSASLDQVQEQYAEISRLLAGIRQHLDHDQQGKEHDAP
jgi:hypothetical protein